MDNLNERQREVLNLLRNQKYLPVASLSKALFASEATIRRDLQKLQEMNLVNRTHGGASINSVQGDLPLSLFNKTSVEQKRKIAMQAATLVRPRDVIFMDATSTVAHLLDYIRGVKGVTIFTNGFETAQCAASNGMDVYLIGGKVKAISSCCYGSFAERFLDEVYFDSMFMSTPALSAEGELTHYSPDVIPLLRSVMPRARQRYLMCIATKFNQTCTYHICRCSELTYVISDEALPPPINMLPRPQP